LDALIASAKSDASRALRDLDGLLAAYAGDPRLLFLKGSWLAGMGDYPSARTAMRQAIDLAPDYAVARFQLGLLELTSGEPVRAQETWAPLHGLPRDHYLRLFVEGLGHLIRDEFQDAIQCLEKGILLNREILPMNRDMEMIIGETRELLKGRKSGQGAVSSVDFLLQQAALKSRH
jgi:tetratricopeptide (TPR) repeat protein